MEAFGAVVALENPPLLAWLDRAGCRSMLGIATHPLWTGPDSAVDLDGPLQAPNEVHLVLTRRCPARCAYCYVSAGPEEPSSPDLAALLETIRALARLGVFHVALGGGESLLDPILFQVADEARRCGLVPNLTTSGLGMTPALAQQCRIFGQVNVSLDGLGRTHRLSRLGGTALEADTDKRLEGKAELAIRALGLLREAGVRVGINTVLTRSAWDGLDDLCTFAQETGVIEVELLRLKPVGRAPATYSQQRLSDEQHLALFPRVLALAERHRLNLKLDCSFAPMICAHHPPPELLRAFAVMGCDAGGALGAIQPDGSLAGCSFLPGGPPGEGQSIDQRWAGAGQLELTRTYPAWAPEPCRSCPYLHLCRGGCRAVAAAVSTEMTEERTADPEASRRPDPECPRVLKWKRG